MFYSFIFTSKGTHMEIQATPKILKIKCLKGSSFLSIIEMYGCYIWLFLGHLCVQWIHLIVACNFTGFFSYNLRVTLTDKIIFLSFSSNM